MIPRIIHQTWKTAEIPAAYQHWQKSWREMHPDFVYRLWTNEDIEDFIREQTVEVQDLFYSYKENISRIDLVRYLILQKFGGLYVDLDFECLHPHHRLFKEHRIMMGIEPETHNQSIKARKARITSTVCNAWMASEPGHPFWTHLINYLISVKNNKDVLNLTGPFALTRAVASYGAKQLTIIPSKYLYPVDKNACWSGEVQDLEFFEKNTRGAFAMHHWVGSWFRSSDHLTRLPLPKSKVIVRPSQGDNSQISLKDHENSLNHTTTDRVLVSCLMVTRGDPQRVRHSIRGFLQQSIESKELIIVTDIHPQSLVMIRNEYASENIRWIFVEPTRRLSLGELRNLSIESASGQYIAQWDDDDLYDPSRLEHQILTIKNSKSTACMLSRWTVWWPNKKRLFISHQRPWEGTLVCARSAMPRYPAMSKAEDTALIKELMAREKVVFLDAPRLYIYVIHGANTWHDAHFEGFFKRSSVDFSTSSYFRVLKEIARRVDVEGYFKGVKYLNSKSLSIKSSKEPIPQDQLPSVLILTPMKNTKKHLNRYFELIGQLDYPRELISIGILEGDSVDGTWSELINQSSSFRHLYASINIDKFDTGFEITGPRWAREIQFARRSNLAHVRNTLLSRNILDQDWVLWIDADVIDYPADLIQRLLSAKKQVVVPLCTKPDGSVFDKNTFIFDKDRATAERPEYLFDGIYQPPSGAGRRYLDSAKDTWVPVDGVGGTALLINGDLHRKGLMFPTFNYKGYIETEGLAVMAKDMGVECWGSSTITVTHAND
jgi:glycosyltransferase involved in cell wall biosynthesis